MDSHISQQPPATRSAARARIAELDNKIASIRTQIATHDLQRQARRKPIDASWFHRAKTALRHLQRERAELSEHLATLPKAKDALKDQVIAVLRERHDEAGWADVMDEAHRRLDGEAP
jgi:chromosome segregation ATPase